MTVVAGNAFSAAKANGDLPLVSIGLPVFNAEPFIAGCLDSLLAQTYPRLELIVSDNGSTDATPRICERYARADKRIRFERQHMNRGAVWNHRRVLELAHGDFFSWAGADDLLAAEFVRACVDALLTEPSAVLAFPRTILIDALGVELGRTSELLPVDSTDPAVRFRRLLSPISVSQNIHYGLVRRAALARVRPFQSFPGADRCLVAELSLMGRFLNVPGYHMMRRQHVGNVSRSDEELQRHADPARVRPFSVREFRVLISHVTAVGRSQQRLMVKLRLLGVVVAWAWRSRRSLTAEGGNLVRGMVKRLLPPRRSAVGEA